MNRFAVDGNYGNPQKRFTAVGLGGGGRKGPIHIGALIRLDEEIARQQSIGTGLIHSIDELDTKSSGAMVGAGYVVQAIEFLNHPGRFNKYSGPAQRLEEILRENPDMYRLLNVWQFLHARDYRGFVDKRPLREFFKKLIGDSDMTFEDIPKGVPELYIVVHNLTTGKDIVFGEVAKKTRIIDALDATVAVAGFIKHEGYRGPAIYGADGEVLATGDGDKFIDGGTLRKNTIAEVMRHDPEMAIDIYLGRPTYPQQVDVKFPDRGLLGKLRLLKNLEQDLGIRLGGDLEIMSAADANKTWFDYQIDILQETGFSVDELLAGKGDGILVATPQGDMLTLGGNGVPAEQVRIGYAAMDSAISAYEAHHFHKTQLKKAPHIFNRAAARLYDKARALRLNPIISR